MIFSFLVLVFLCKNSKGDIFYPYGLTENDTLVKSDNFFTVASGLINLDVPYKGYPQFHIYDNGYLSVKPSTRPQPKSKDVTGILPYYGMFSVKMGGLYYRQVNDQAIQQYVNESIRMRFPKHHFIPQNTLIVTYSQKFQFHTEWTNTFQMILTYNDEHSYLISNYKELKNDGATVAYNFQCYHSFAPPISTSKLQHNSNIGVKGRFVWSLHDIDCDPKKTYIHKGMHNVSILNKGDNVEQKVNLTKPIPLFEGRHSTIYLYSDGYIRTEPEIFPLPATTNSYLLHYDMLAFFEHDFNVTGRNQGDILFYETTDNQELLDRASAEMTRFFWKDFVAQQLFVISYENCASKIGLNVSFQIVLVSNGHDTYAVMSFYGDYVPAYIGYTSKQCNLDTFFGRGDKNYLENTNTGKEGEFIFKVNDKACIKKVMLPYGGTEGDYVITEADDLNFHIRLRKSMPLFTKMGRNLYISSNGMVTHTRSPSNVVTDFLSDNIAFAGFYTDLKTNGIGRIFHRETFRNDTLNFINELINQRDFSCNHAIVVTYENMPEFGVYTSRNSFQIVLASDGKVTYGLALYYRVDSYDRAMVGYGEATCNTGIKVAPPSQQQLDEFGHRVNTKIFLLTNSVCKAKIDSYLYSYGESVGDQLLPYDSLNPVRELVVEDPFQYFDKDVHKIYISKYGFISLHEPAQHSLVWFPYKYTSIIYGYLTLLPGNVYYRQTNDTAEINVLLENLIEMNLRTTFDSVIIITYHTESRNDPEDSHLRTNNFQIILANRPGSPVYIRFIYRRLDYIFGISGFSVPGCYQGQIVDPRASHYLTVTSNGERHYFGWSNCNTKHTAFLPNGAVCGDLFNSNFNNDFYQEPQRVDYWTQKRYMPIFYGRSLFLVKINPNGLITLNQDLAAEDVSKINQYSVITGFVDPGWKDYRQNDGLNFREIDNFGSTFDLLTLRMLNEAVSKYLGEDEPFHGTGGLVITFNSINKMVYQVAIVSNYTQTFVVMNLLELGPYGFHGVSNPHCPYPMVNFISQYADVVALKDGSNNGVSGQYVYPLTDRLCIDPSTITTTTTTTTTTTFNTSTHTNKPSLTSTLSLHNNTVPPQTTEDKEEDNHHGNDSLATTRTPLLYSTLSPTTSGTTSTTPFKRPGNDGNGGENRVKSKRESQVSSETTSIIGWSVGAFSLLIFCIIVYVVLKRRPRDQFEQA